MSKCVQNFTCLPKNDPEHQQIFNQILTVCKQNPFKQMIKKYKIELFIF